MGLLKENLLNSTYDTLINVALKKHPINEIAEHIDDRFMAYGTANDEKIFGLDGFRWMIERQWEEVDVARTEIKQHPVSRQFFNEKNSALIVEEIEILVHEGEDTISLSFRISTLLEYDGEKWVILHIHSSIGDANTLEGSAWPIGELKRRNIELEQQVAEKTADLQEKNRELEIEAALDRVRSVSMAMHESDELVEVAAVVIQQLIGLGFDSVVSGGFNFPDAENNITQCWFAYTTDSLLDDFRIPFAGDPVLDERHEYREKGIPFLEQVLKGEEVKRHMEFVFPKEEASDEEIASGEAAPDPTIFSIQFLNEGYMILLSNAPLNEEQKTIMGRFASVFNSGYTRFLDLKKAEEQAREAEIEAALERVRTKGMAMQSTDEIESATKIVFNELSRLGIEMERCGITLLNETPIAELWSTTLSQENREVIDIVTGYLDFRIHPLLQQAYQDWKEKKRYSEIKLEGVEVQKYYSILEKQPEYKFPKVANYPDQQILHSFFFNAGAIFVYTTNGMPDESKRIMQRFTNVFEQTYTRFLDIQRAEKLAVETARQASLDRIRAEIGSMRSTDDLNQVTPIIWDELKTLEIPFIRCGVFIINEEKQISHTYLSTSQGEPIAALHLPIEGISLVENAVSSWKEREIYTEHWDKDDFYDWTQNLIDGDFIQSKKKYEAGSVPESLDLHFLPFKHGMLYIGNTEPLSQEKLDLGQSMAKAFSVAYDRYEDFNKLEQAKQKIEEAFKELEAAKDQLVQQEKLASLGQLTAGIAHEIKNPLNFVNNFSEVSIELVEEAREEVKGQKANVKTGNKPLLYGEMRDDQTNLILDILDDVEANLRKIHEHGSRADRIVKSMLQHSRGGKGQMQPTDLNALVKEYVNLSYHGMRASPNRISVELELDLDNSLGEIIVNPEEMSRVVVNLCNNAFDAMAEKTKVKSEKGEEYFPVLMFRTRLANGAARLEVEDNGPGIPAEIKDNILQPFFTTKQGTEGTGLGLSITNDIVKAHGGNIDIESRKGISTTFRITIPKNPKKNENSGR